MLRCVVCRSRRASFRSLLDHQRASGHLRPCCCSGYHFPHRSGSPLCDAAPYHRAARARAEGASADDVLDAMIDDILFNDHSGQAPCEEPPF